MENYRLGLYEKSLPRDLTWKEKLKAAKTAGYDYVEMSIDESDVFMARLKQSKKERQDLVNIMHECGIRIDSICLSGQRKYPMGSTDKDIREKSMKLIKDAIDYAYDLGIHIIQIAGYDVYYDGESTEETRLNFINGLVEASEYASSKGILLGIETMETDFLNTVEKGMTYINEVKSSYLKMYPDVGNIRNATEDTVSDLIKGEMHIVAAHLKETRENVFRDMRFGEGRVDFRSMCQTLKDLNVRMYTAEFWYDGGEDWETKIKDAYDFLEPILKTS